MKAIISLIIVGALGFVAWQFSRSAQKPAPAMSQPAEEVVGKAYTMAQVAEHKDVASCLTVIRGTVYDLTAWISKHPGGDKNILKLCGIDGTSAFETKHGGQEKPEKVLEGFAVGSLMR